MYAAKSPNRSLSQQTHKSHQNAVARLVSKELQGVVGQVLHALGAVVVPLDVAAVALDAPDNVLADAAAAARVVGGPGGAHGGAVGVQPDEEVDPGRRHGQGQVLERLRRVAERVDRVPVAVEVVKDKGHLFLNGMYQHGGGLCYIVEVMGIRLTSWKCVAEMFGVTPLTVTSKRYEYDGTPASLQAMLARRRR